VNKSRRCEKPTWLPRSNRDAHRCAHLHHLTRIQCLVIDKRTHTLTTTKSVVDDCCGSVSMSAATAPSTPRASWSDWLSTGLKDVALTGAHARCLRAAVQHNMEALTTFCSSGAVLRHAQTSSSKLVTWRAQTRS
jgi:hypothetical protein